LRVRYEKLGFTFDRTQLDEIYRRFVTLADKIKTVEDGHLMQLVRDVPARTSTIPDSAAKTANTWMAPISRGDVNHGDARHGDVSHGDVHAAPAEPAGAREKAHAAHGHGHEGEQEDYLWGV
jgi:hypothetical protein